MTASQSGVLRLKAPRDERGEAAGLFLQLVEPLEVIDAILDVLAYPNIIVAVVRMPSWCAVRCTLSQSSVRHLSRAIL